MPTLVHGDGPKDADVLLLGEAPGKTEIKRGKPFVGKSGKLLMKLMSSVGLKRSEVYVTNVVKQKTPSNNTEKWRKNNPEKFAHYKEKVKQEIEEVDPNVVVPLGKTALRLMTGKEKVTKWRGSIVESEFVEGQKTIPTIHPAAAMRMYIWRYWIKFDFQRVIEEAEKPEMPNLDFDLITSPSFDECISYLDKCLQADFHAFDIEVSGKEVSCISFSYDGDNAISIPFMEGTSTGIQEYFTTDQEVEIWKKIAALLEDESITSIAHNATFDVTFLNECYGIVPSSVHDTMVAEAILWPDFPKGLDFVTSIYTKIPYYKDDGKHAKALGEKYWRYNAKDSIVLTKAWPEMRDNLRQMNRWEIYDHQRRLIEPACFMTRIGVDVDKEGLDEWSKDLEEKYQEKLDEIEEYTGDYGRINPNSPKQVKEYFYEFRGEKPYLKNGRPTTREKAMKQLAGTKGYEEASLILEARGFSKLKGTYADIDLDEDGRMRGSINVVGTRFGRFSSSQTIHGTGGNMQNLPYGFRGYLRPDMDYVGYEVDAGQAENRVVAYLGPDHNMMKAFESDADIHSKTAALVLEQFSYEEVREMEEEGIPCDVGNGKQTPRQWGKRCNHALNYGMGARKFARQVEIPVKEAKRLRAKYLRAYPGVEKFWEYVKRKLGKDRELVNMFGRRYKFLDRWGSSLFKDAYAFIPQSTVADLINYGAVRELYEKQNVYGEVELLSQVHDSVWLQIPKKVGWTRHAEILMNLSNSMEMELEWRGRKFSIPAEVEIAPLNWKDMHEIGEVTDRSIEWLASKIQHHHDRMIEEA